MTRERVTNGLGALIGVGYIVVGVIESSIAIAGRDSIVFFWFPALCGGGALVLLGVFKVVRPPWASVGLVTVGSLAGALAMVWTLFVPVLALALIGLISGRAGQLEGKAGRA
jgi:hypothetical protein